MMDHFGSGKFPPSLAEKANDESAYKPTMMPLSGSHWVLHTAVASLFFFFPLSALVRIWSKILPAVGKILVRLPNNRAGRLPLAERLLTSSSRGAEVL